jgi:hypothetical protein
MPMLAIASSARRRLSVVHDAYVDVRETGLLTRLRATSA